MKKIYMQPTAKTVKLNNQVILAGSGPVAEGENNFNTAAEEIEDFEDIAAKRTGRFSYEW